ncbi:acyltransferase family protein [Chitinophaga sp. RAB17]|uniref:acyltransferase family protein n=1 Tax=Chitinophaga sp. RAB17 TaxID=3233049 RepID=UPI003F92B43D
MEKNVTRNSWVDNLRSFITILVVAHHAALAYATFSWFNKTVYIASTHPVVDAVRSRELDVLVIFNDGFFMSLMFLISGIFVMPSLQNKQVGIFIRDRFFRLFIPFVIGVTLLMLLAYYPAFYLAYGKTNLKAYVIDFFTVEAWPVGPPWFIWVLFLFNLIFALCYPFVKNGISMSGAWLALQKQRPLKLLLLWYVFTWIVYVPFILLVSPDAWTGIGPFDFQISRFLLYFGYFLLGILIGVPGLNNGIFAGEAVWVKRWPVWLLACVAVFVLLMFIAAPLTVMVQQHQLSEVQGILIYRSVWILSCTLSSIAFLTTFKSIFNKTGRWWKSLAANAYGIYLVHYIFVVWCQFLLLDFNLPALVKFFITFFFAVGMSWWVTFWVRKNAVIGKYL